MVIHHQTHAHVCLFALVVAAQGSTIQPTTITQQIKNTVSPRSANTCPTNSTTTPGFARRPCDAKIINNVATAQDCRLLCCASASRYQPNDGCTAWFINDYNQCFMCSAARQHPTPPAVPANKGNGCSKTPTNCSTGLVTPSIDPRGPTNWSRTADFTLTENLLASDPGAFTATVATGPVNTLMHFGGFEPLMVRRRYIAASGSSADVFAIDPNELSVYNTYRDRWLDGAAIRIYRLTNGNFTLVRHDVVKATRCNSWDFALGMPNQVLTKATYTLTLDSWCKPNATLWYAVASVDSNGNSSALSIPIRVDNVPLPVKGSPAPPQNALVPAPKSPNPLHPNATVPPAPTGLTAHVDYGDGTTTFTWDTVAWPSLAGYTVVSSSVPPNSLPAQTGLLLVGGAGDAAAAAAAAGSADNTTTPAPILVGDLAFVERKDYTWNRSTLSYRVWNAESGRNPLSLSVGGREPVYNGEEFDVQWNLVPHPTPVPGGLAPVAGETCARIQVGADMGNTTVVLSSGGLAASRDQSYYPVLLPSETYIVELWARTAVAPAQLTLQGFRAPDGKGKSINLVDDVLNLTARWQLFKTTFRAPVVFEGGGAVQSLNLMFAGPLDFFIDNWRVFKDDAPFVGLSPTNVAALNESGLSFIRTHAFIKSTFGYGMESLTNPAGVTQAQYNMGPKTMHTLASMFKMMLDGGCNPWLQVEQFMSEEELLGFVEYIAAPYDTTKGDSPTTKPWAAKRAVQGQVMPYTDMFNSFMYEISNEEWNPMFMPWGFAYGTCMPDHGRGGVLVCGGALLGLWQEKTIRVLRSSLYWTNAVEEKFTFAIGGWAISDGAPEGWHHGFGTQAAVASPSSSVVNIAGYNGGWDAGEAAAVPNDQGFFKALSFTAQSAEPVAALMQSIRSNLSEYNNTKIFDGTYEAGPGYNLNGLNNVKMNASQVEAESQVMKSLAAGTATLDSFLARAAHGFVVQNFFTFERNRDYWTSHAPLSSGGQAYPSWKALSLFNVNGTGDFLKVLTNSVPTVQLQGPGGGGRASVPNAPVVSVYVTTKKSAARVNIFVLSRKLDGYPFAGDGYASVTLRLPFKLGSAGRITRYRLAGQPRANNLDDDAVKLEVDEVPLSAFGGGTFVMSDTTAADARGLSPGATYMYQFDGVVW